MSKLRLFGLSLVLLSLFSLGGNAASACLTIIVYATNNTTGECREFSSPCAVPKGWTVVSYVGCPA